MDGCLKEIVSISSQAWPLNPLSHLLIESVNEYYLHWFSSQTPWLLHSLISTCFLVLIIHALGHVAFVNWVGVVNE